MTSPKTTIELRPDVLGALMIAMARENFYNFCRIRMPKQYGQDRPHLKVLCDTLQTFVLDQLLGEDGRPVQNLIITMPPRHGKTLTLVLLAQWILGLRPLASIIDVSYNETLSGRYGRYVRDGMQEIKNGFRVVYSEIFPESRVKDGDASFQLWSLVGSHFSFLATSPGGTMTGNGAGFGFIDDLIKNAMEAYNERVLQEHVDFFNNTFMSRMDDNQNPKKILCMTRWSTGDLIGHILKTEPEKWHVVKMRANKNYPADPRGDQDMLCPSMLRAVTYLDRKQTTDPVIFAANYDQEPFDSHDSLYGTFKTYRPEDFPKAGRNEAYVDTADQGSDFLAGFTYRVHDNLLYVQDVLYTQDPMERTELDTARMLQNSNTEKAFIESNNGGRGFARNVERIMRENGYTRCMVDWFHQSENKWARILTNATSVSNCVVMPADWKTRWPQFHRDVYLITHMSKPKRDDAPDMLTGGVEKSGLGGGFEIF